MNQLIIHKPVITEKSIASQQTQDKYAFWAPLSATKNQIKTSFKAVFGINPLSINTVIVKGKTKTNWKTRHQIQKSDRKKAVIAVPKGTKIELLKLNTK
jgi:large subunit ribosomal protein L23